MRMMCMTKTRLMNIDELEDVIFGEDINISRMKACVRYLFPAVTCRKPSMEVKPFLRAM